MKNHFIYSYRGNKRDEVKNIYNAMDEMGKVFENPKIKYISIDIIDMCNCDKMFIDMFNSYKINKKTSAYLLNILNILMEGFKMRNDALDEIKKELDKLKNHSKELDSKDKKKRNDMCYLVAIMESHEYGRIYEYIRYYKECLQLTSIFFDYLHDTSILVLYHNLFNINVSDIVRIGRNVKCYYNPQKYHPKDKCDG